MKPELGKNLINRFLTWVRGMWAESAGRRRSGASGSGAAEDPGTAPGGRPADPQADQPGSVGGSGVDDIAANGSPGGDRTAPTGASQDEFASGGYTPDNPDLKTVEEAAESGEDSAQPGDSRGDTPPSPAAESLVDQEMEGPTPPSGNYGVGNLSLGSQGSLGAVSQPDASAGVDAAPVDLAEAAIPDDTDARQPGVIDAQAIDDDAPGLSGTVGDEGLSTLAERDIRGIGDLGAEELGSLEELDESAIAFQDDASEAYDANSEPGFGADVPDSLAEIDRETDDYGSPAAQDSGLRIVDEDEAGLSMRMPADDEFVDPGSVIDEPAEETEDARPLGDYTQIRSGIANEADEPVSVAGDRSTEPFGSTTGMDTAQTWTEGAATENLRASDFGSTVGDDREAGSIGLAGTSDIDVADLSYLDESEAARFEFSDSTASMPESAGVVDDIGPSPTGVRDSEGAVESELPGSTGPEAGRPLVSEDLPDSVSAVADEIADSPTGVVDADVTAEAVEDGPSSPSGARANIPNFATDKDSDPAPASGPARSGPGDSIRGDESGNCPADFPIKGNSSSKIYHVPDIPSYQGTKAEWCFASEEQAQGAGYRPPGQRNRGGGRSSSGPNSGRGGRSRGTSSR